MYVIWCPVLDMFWSNAGFIDSINDAALYLHTYVAEEVARNINTLHTLSIEPLSDFIDAW